MSGDAWVIESRVQALSADRLLDRFHELVDLRFAGQMDLAESFELERIEARLNLQDEDEIDRMAVLQDDWKSKRDELLTSIESLLARIKAASRSPVSQFFRNESPPEFDDYGKYRPFLRRDFRFTCAYCERPEPALGGEEFFEIDHFRPVKKFPGHVGRYASLYYAFGKCNRHKGNTWPSEYPMGRGFRFADPCEEDLYVTHLEEAPDGRLRTLTPVGDYTCQHIRLNRSGLLAWRQQKRMLQALGEEMRLLLEIKLESVLQDELRQKIATLALLRQGYSL
jgi:5-methylcytosine-specific restriction endonuclease McrA